MSCVPLNLAVGENVIIYMYYSFASSKLIYRGLNINISAEGDKRE